MKILIAYDGSECADEAVEDLRRAGIPENTEATVLTLTETFTTAEEAHEVQFADTFGFTLAETFKAERGAALEKIAEAEKFNERAARRLRGMFPSWTVVGKTTNDFPEYAILDEAKKLKPDLIVTGSHGHGTVKRAFFGSVSLSILRDANCSVRIGRRLTAREEFDDSPLRIVVAIDGSSVAQFAVEEILHRDFSPDTSFRIVSAVEPMPYSILLAEMPQAEAMRKKAAQKFMEKGWHTSIVSQFGRAKTVIVEEAEKWGADAIFIGAQGHTSIERVLLGSVSYAVCARAHCSVEVVRPRIVIPPEA